jgi:hypothetical protein
MQGVKWLEESEEYKLKLIVAELKYRDVRGVVRKHPLKLEHLLHIMQKVDIKKEKELYGMTLLYLGHDGLLRVGELASGLTTADVSWGVDRKSFTLHLKRSKANRKDGAEFVTYADRSGWNAVRLMRMYYDKFDLWHQHNIQLFPKIDSKGRLQYRHSLSKDWVRRYVKRCVVLIGLDPKDFSGHSLRAGGATDLFIAKVPYPIIKKFGRWKSDAALIYYRDEEDLAALVSNAFNSITVTLHGKIR